MAEQVEQVVFNISGMESHTDQLQVINAMRKYSGVLDVAVEPNSNKVQVVYEKYNILPKDLMLSVENAGYDVEILQQT